MRRETDAFKRLIEAKATMLVPTPNHAVGIGGGGVGGTANTALSTNAIGSAGRGASFKDKPALAMDTRTVHWNAVGAGVKVGDKQALATPGGSENASASPSSLTSSSLALSSYDSGNANKRRVIVDVREFRSSLPSFLHGSGLHIDACTLLVGVLRRTIMLFILYRFTLFYLCSIPSLSLLLLFLSLM